MEYFGIWFDRPHLRRQVERSLRPGWKRRAVPIVAAIVPGEPAYLASDDLRARQTPPRTWRRSRADAATGATRVVAAVGAVGLDRVQFGPTAQQRVADGVRLGPRERADRVDQPAPGAEPRRRPADAIASWSAARPLSRSLAARRQSSSGRRRAEPTPLHGASTSTRSNGPATAGIAASCTSNQGRRRMRAADVRSDRRDSPSDPRPERVPRPRRCRRCVGPCRRERRMRHSMRSPADGSRARTT